MTSIRFALPLVALFAVGCQDLQRVFEGVEKPTARVVGVGFEGLSLEGVTLRFDVEVGNPYAFALPLAKLDYNLKSAGKQFVAGTADVGGSVAAKGKRIIPLTAGVKFGDMMSVVGGIRPGSLVPYEAAMTLSANAPAIGRVSVPLKHEGKVPVPAVPEVSVQGLRWDELSLNNARATVTLNVKNTNGFGVGLEKMGYALSLGGQEVAGGGVEGGTKFDKGQTQSLQVPVSFSPARFGLAMFNLLRGEKADYGLRGDMDLSTDYGTIKMPYNSRGQAKFTSK